MGDAAMMTPATAPRGDPRTTRLLAVDPRSGSLVDGTIGDIRARLRAGDLLVVNDAATLPASLRGVTESGAPVEVRLAGERGDGSWRAVLFGAGDWRTRTEERPAPPDLRAGEALLFDGLHATITGVDRGSPRLVSLAFDERGAALWRGLYRAGRPVQYSHAAAPLALWQVQTAYAARPWAAEAPSAGFGLTWDLLLDLRRAGVGVARVTDAAGLSATGDRELDARLPLAERYEVSAEAAHAVAAARARGGRVVAVGTSVARALETAALHGGGRLAASQGTTELLLGPGFRRQAVDGIVTGVHDPGTSHFLLLESFAPETLLHRAYDLAESLGYRGHEFGDAMLILEDPPQAAGALHRATGSSRTLGCSASW
jgi:S-adenosylmethionine:tRNA ribosyltransferase-isomerase